MKRLRRRVGSLLLVLACLALSGAVWLLWPRSAITAANAARIEQGMTLEQVKAILGGPARDELTGPAVMEPDWDALKRVFRDVDQRPVLVWGSDSVRIFVQFGSDESVIKIVTVPVHRISP